MRRGAVAVLLFLLAAVSFSNERAPASADGALTVRIEAVDDASASGTAVVTVLGADGRPVVGLKADSFALTDAGEPVAISAITRAENASVGIAVVLAIDTSLSMRPVLGAARTGASGVVANIGSDDHAAVISFASGVSTNHTLTADPDSLATALDSLVADGPTALYDAVLVAIDLAQSAPLDRRVVILLTDGVDDGSVATRIEALEAAGQAGVAIYAIGFGAETDESFLQSLATASDGTFLLAPETGAMASAFSDFTAILRSQYVIEFAPAPATTSLSRLFTVTVIAGEATATTERSYPSSRPAAVVTAVAANPAVTAPVADPPSIEAALPLAVATPAADSSTPLMLAGSLAVMVAMATGAFVVVRRRNTVAPTPALLARTPRPSSPAETARAVASLHPLHPNAHREHIIVEGDLLLLGDDGTCSTGPRTGGFRADGAARLWWRDGKLMLHHRATFGRRAESSWATLVSGDVIQIGPDEFRVEIEQPPAKTRS